MTFLDSHFTPTGPVGDAIKKFLVGLTGGATHLLVTFGVTSILLATRLPTWVALAISLAFALPFYVYKEYREYKMGDETVVSASMDVLWAFAGFLLSFFLFV